MGTVKLWPKEPRPRLDDMQFVSGGPEPLAPEFQTQSTVALKELLEKKHLYQSVKTDTGFVATMAKERVANMEDSLGRRTTAVDLTRRAVYQ